VRVSPSLLHIRATILARTSDLFNSGRELGGL
jgi:hypothetical protein